MKRGEGGSEGRGKGCEDDDGGCAGGYIWKGKGGRGSRVRREVGIRGGERGIGVGRGRGVGRDMEGVGAREGD